MKIQRAEAEYPVRLEVKVSQPRRRELVPGVAGLVLLGLRDQSSYFSVVCNFQGS